MQIGSIVTPKYDITPSFRHLGRMINLYRPLKKGELLTISYIQQGPNQDGKIVFGLCFYELGFEFNSSFKEPAGFDIDDFIELMTPSNIADELFSHQTERGEL